MLVQWESEYTLTVSVTGEYVSNWSPLVHLCERV